LTCHSGAINHMLWFLLVLSVSQAANPQEKVAICALKEAIPRLLLDCNKDNFCMTPNIFQCNSANDSITVISISGSETRTLGGSLPTQIGLLSNLIELELVDANLTGTLPTQLGLLSNLQKLYLPANKFGGTIPTQLGNLRKLHSLILSSNEFASTIPTQIYRLPELESLYLNENRIVGPISTSVSKLSNLKSLVLYKNEISGTIPSHIALLKNLSLFDVSTNLLHGGIPTEFTELKYLKQMYLFMNHLEHQIPTEIGAIPRLSYLDLTANYITGTIPTEIGNLDLLFSFLVTDNNLNGTIPTQLGRCQYAKFLFLQGNKLTGTIPTELMAIKLRSLSLSDNPLHGTIPALPSVCELTQISLANCGLSGTMPEGLSNCLNLEELHLPFNSLTGHLVVERLPFLKRFDLSFNKIHDVQVIGNPMLNTIALPGNDITTVTIEQNYRLEMIDLQDNKIGYFPKFLMHNASETPQPIAIVYLQSNQIHEKLITEINWKIHVLDLSRNQIFVDNNKVQSVTAYDPIRREYPSCRDTGNPRSINLIGNLIKNRRTIDLITQYTGTRMDFECPRFLKREINIHPQACPSVDDFLSVGLKCQSCFDTWQEQHEYADPEGWKPLLKAAGINHKNIEAALRCPGCQQNDATVRRVRTRFLSKDRGCKTASGPTRQEVECSYPCTRSTKIGFPQEAVSVLVSELRKTISGWHDSDKPTNFFTSLLEKNYTYGWLEVKLGAQTEFDIFS